MYQYLLLRRIESSAIPWGLWTRSMRHVWHSDVPHCKIMRSLLAAAIALSLQAAAICLPWCLLAYADILLTHAHTHTHTQMHKIRNCIYLNSIARSSAANALSANCSLIKQTHIHTQTHLHVERHVDVCSLRRSIILARATCSRHLAAASSNK